MATPPQLRAALRRLGLATPRQLLAELGVSQPTLSRSIAEAGDSIWRVGRARAVRYALTRAVEGVELRPWVHRVDEAGQATRWARLVPLEGGGHGLEPATGAAATVFTGLPPFVADMAPQGFLGRGFPSRHPELGLPPRIVDWTDDHRLVAVSRRGEDLIGDLLVGDETLERFFALAPTPVSPEQYPELARRTLTGEVGPSAGGEHPKFLCFSEGRHVLVKFAEADASTASQRWRDLLVAEHLALETVRDAGVEAAASRLHVVEGMHFLEVERFDRVGARGRRGVLSLAALDNEYTGVGRSWPTVAEALERHGLLSAADVQRVVWLDTFGQLIANTDRHLGNLAVLSGDDGYRVAPVYDMLPMLFAPTVGGVVERQFQPAPPTSNSLAAWPAAARAALRFWQRLAEHPLPSEGFRRLATRGAEAVSKLGERIGLL